MNTIFLIHIRKIFILLRIYLIIYLLIYESGCERYNLYCEFEIEKYFYRFVFKLNINMKVIIYIYCGYISLRAQILCYLRPLPINWWIIELSIIFIYRYISVKLFVSYLSQILSTSVDSFVIPTHEASRLSILEMSLKWHVVNENDTS